MYVIAGLFLGLINCLTYCLSEATYTCPQGFTCADIKDCQQVGVNEGDLVYPCNHRKYVCCGKLKQQSISDVTTTRNAPFTSVPAVLRNQTQEYLPFNLNASSNLYNNIPQDTKGIRNSNHNNHLNVDDNRSSGNSNGFNLNINQESLYNEHPNNNGVDRTNHSWIPRAKDNYIPPRLNIPDYTNENDKSQTNFLYSANSNASRSGDKQNAIIVKRRDPFKKNCGLSIADDKITGGQIAELGQFPWMALLGFKQTSSQNTQFLCGGSLITNRHVLTAAHCIVENRPLELVMVRLGEYNLTTSPDCVTFGNDQICADQHVDIPVDSVLVHPLYNRKKLKNDIAIIKVRQMVRESEYIRTICLPFDRDISNLDLAGQNFTVSGWGKSKSGDLFGSDILQFAKVTSWNQKKCDDSIPSEVKPLSSTQMCANGPNTEDACKGDSGGPLINITLDKDSEIRHIQYGIVSFGTATCGDRNLPTIYTRVDQYLHWILENAT